LLHSSTSEINQNIEV